MNNQEFRIYRPNKAGQGAASQIQLIEKDGKQTVFWTMTKQTGTDANGNASFGWKEKDKTVIFKLEDNDLGELLSVMYRYAEKAGGDKGIYHQNESGNTVMHFDGKSVRLSTKRKEEELLAISHSINPSELALLKVIFELIVEKRFLSFFRKNNDGQ